jgi:DNA-binding CsgD family transcriptional regulator
MTEIVERDSVLDLLADQLDTAVAGCGRVVSVTGPVGIGKSALLGAFADRVLEHGALPITARGCATEQQLPLGLFNQLLYDAPLPPADRQRVLDLLREGTRGLALTRPDQDGGHLEGHLTHALCAELLALAERYPLAILIDDVQHADRASLVCLAYLSRRLRFAQMMLVLTHATEEGTADNLLHDDLLLSPYATTAQVLPLSRNGLAAMAAELTGPADAERFATRWHTLSGGNPSLVVGLLNDHAAGLVEETDEVAVGEGYGKSILTCLQRGERWVMEVARALAIQSDPDVAGRLIDIDGALVRQAIRALEIRGVLCEGQYRHPVARDAVVADIDGQVLARLHRQAASLAYERGAEPAVVAEHLVRSNGLSESWVVSVLEDAARKALREGHVEPGLAYLRLAGRECRDKVRRNEIMTMLLQAEARINPAMSGDLLTQLTTGMNHGQLRGDDAAVVVNALLWHGRFGDAQEMLRRLGAAAEGDDRPVPAEVAINQQWLRSTYPGLRESRPAPAPAGSVPAVRRYTALKLLADLLENGPTGAGVEAIERTLRASHLGDNTIDTIESSLLTLIYSDRSEDAVAWCDVFAEEANRRQEPARQARMASLRAEISLRLGDLSGAVQRARSALQIIPPRSWGVVVGAPLSTLIVAGTALGHQDEVQAWLDQPVPEAMFQTRFGLTYLQARGRYSLSTGHPNLALRDFTRCGELMKEWGFDTPSLVAWRLDAAEAHIAAGRAHQAAPMVEEQLNASAQLPRVRGIALRLLAATSLPRHRPMLLRQSGDLLQGTGDRYELARSLTALTEAFEALGEFRRAAVISRRAQALAEECDIRLRTQERPAPRDAATGPASLLSDAERRVAALAAVGYTNREISSKLFITLSTVEQHLTRIYRKLNVTSRASLPANLDVTRPVEATEQA